MISIDKFTIIVENTPLISIDFLIQDENTNYLLGRRTNAPAKGYWFTLGGRILKDETIRDAIARLSKKEFNLVVSEDMLKFHGVYEHFYDDSFVDDKITTHYVVLVYIFKLDSPLTLPKNEHDEYSYFSKQEILKNNYVHQHVKDYFN